jgi:hypothetical protein
VRVARGGLGDVLISVQRQDIADTINVNTSLTGASTGHALEGVPSYESKD